MRVRYDITTEQVQLIFEVSEREMALIIFQDAIDRYQDAGFDCSGLVSALHCLVHNDSTIN